MAGYVALLRGINVGGKNTIPMAELRTMFADLGFVDVETLLQSGNVVFGHSKKSDQQVEQMLEKETEKRFGIKVDYMVRNAGEVADIVKANPFKREAMKDPGHLLVLFLKDDAKKSAQSDLGSAIKGREVVKVSGRHIYAVYPDGAGVSKLTNAVLEKHLETRVTGRNWNTVMKLLKKCKVEERRKR